MNDSKLARINELYKKSIDVVNEDGTVENLGEKYGSKKQSS